MTELSLVVASVLTLLVIVYLINWSSRQGTRAQTAILCLTLLHETVVVVFPAFYSICTDFYLETAISSKPVDLLTVMAGEVTFMVMFAIGLKFGHAFKKRAKSTYNAIGENSADSVSIEVNRDSYDILLYFLVIFALVLSFTKFLSPVVVGSEYFATIDGSISSTSMLSNIIGILDSLFSFPAFLAAVLIFGWPASGKPKKWVIKLAAFAVLATTIILSVSSGARGRFVWLFCGLFYFYYVNRNRRMLFRGTIVLVFSLFVFSYFTGIKHSIGQFVRNNASRIDLIKFVIEEGVSRAKGDPLRLGDMLENLASRGQAARNSTILYELYQDDKGLGLKHYLASLAPIPRFIWQNKPLVGSIDETIYGRAIYIVMRIGYGTFYNMGPILASAHAYWEGGWPWLFALGLILGLFWNYYLKWCDTLGGELSHFFMVLPTGAFLVDGFFTAMMPLHNIFHFCWLSVLPTYLLYKLISRWQLYRQRKCYV